ncbi:MAG: Gfo/Idh/MocA family oxidoreductase [Planctomycetota bacterium]
MSDGMSGDMGGERSGTDRRGFLQQAAGLAAAAAFVPSLSAAMGRFGAPVRVGVVGCGRQGRAIIAELGSFPDVEIAAVADIEPRRLRAGARRTPGAKTYESHAAMLDAEKLDAVFIATPTHLHLEPVRDALQAGAHVYCEAPLAHTPEDARAIAAAARGSGKVFQSGFNARANPVYQLARTFFVSDAVRRLAAMEAVRARKTTWRTPTNNPEQDRALNWRLYPDVSTGLAGEWGSHQFDVFHWYTGRYPEAIQGMGSVRLHEDGREVADSIKLMMKFPGGAGLGYTATLANSYEGMHEILRGENAAIKLAWSHGWMFKEADAPTQGWEVYANRQQFHDDEGITLIAGATQLAEQGKLKDGVGLPHSALWYGLEAFLKSVTEGAAVTCSADEGVRATIVGIKANEAVVSGETVRIDPSELS